MLRITHKDIGINALLLTTLLVGLTSVEQSVQAQKFIPLASPVYSGRSSPELGRVPRLIRAKANHSSPGASTIYQFTIVVPKDSPDALKAVTLAQRSGVEKIDFKVNQSQAVIGSTLASGSPLALTPMGGNQPENAHEVTLVFERPVQPGETVTFGLKVPHNPLNGGIYTFGVTAFPENDARPSLYLGSGRIHLSAH